MVSPAAFASISSSTRSRYSSWYFSGSKSAVSESISCCAIWTSRSETSTSSSGRSSIASGGTTSSWKTIVAIASALPLARIATRFSFWRITTRAIATLFVSRIASSRRR